MTLVDSGQVALLIISSPIWAAALLLTASGLRLRELGRGVRRGTCVDGIVVGHVQLPESKEHAHIVEFNPSSLSPVVRFAERPIKGRRPTLVGHTVRVSYQVDDPANAKRVSLWRHVAGWAATSVGTTFTLAFTVLLRPTGFTAAAILMVVALLVRHSLKRPFSQALAYRRVSVERIGEIAERTGLIGGRRSGTLPPAPSADDLRVGYRSGARFAVAFTLALFVIDLRSGTNGWIAVAIPLVTSVIGAAHAGWGRLPGAEERSAAVSGYVSRRDSEEQRWRYSPIVEFTDGRTRLRFVGDDEPTKRYAVAEPIAMLFRAGNKPKAKVLRDHRSDVRNLWLLGIPVIAAVAAWASLWTALNSAVVAIAIWWFRDRVAINAGSPVEVVPSPGPSDSTSIPEGDGFHGQDRKQPR